MCGSGSSLHSPVSLDVESLQLHARDDTKAVVPCTSQRPGETRIAGRRRSDGSTVAEYDTSGYNVSKSKTMLGLYMAWNALLP